MQKSKQNLSYPRQRMSNLLNDNNNDINSNNNNKNTDSTMINIENNSTKQYHQDHDLDYENKTSSSLRYKIYLLTFVIYILVIGNRVSLSIIKSTLLKTFPPFSMEQNKEQGIYLLGWLDTCFLLSYAIGSLFSSIIISKISRAILLPCSLAGCGIASLLQAVAYWKDIHYIEYFFIINIFAGFMQSVIGPLCLTLMTNCFYPKVSSSSSSSKNNNNNNNNNNTNLKSKFGLIMGLWSSYNGVSSFLFKLIGSRLLKQYNWGCVFVLPGVLSIVFAMIIFYKWKDNLLFDNIYIIDNNNNYKTNIKETIKITTTTASETTIERIPEITITSFFTIKKAFQIPGVVPYALCLFFTKLLVYTLSFWLAQFLSLLQFSPTLANNISSMYDIGGILGGIFSGWFVDSFPKRKSIFITISFLFLIPFFFELKHINSVMGFSLIFFILFLIGFLLYIPYVLISSLIINDFQPPDYSSSSSSSSFHHYQYVYGIINGIGGIGAALQGVITSYLVNDFGLNSIFYALAIYSFMGALLSIYISWSQYKGNYKK